MRISFAQWTELRIINNVPFMLKMGLCNQKPCGILHNNVIGIHIYFDYFLIEKIDALPDMLPHSFKLAFMWVKSVPKGESAIYLLSKP